MFKVSEEVRAAISDKKPVVALESTIYTHGFPYPENLKLANHLETLVRIQGAVPATCAVLNGIARVGLEPEELSALVEDHTATKVSRRDLGYITGLGIAGKGVNGGTTISGTMVLSHLAGIKVFATGGLGGVHRGGEYSLDISADLTELGRTPVAVISSGCKGFLDIPKTIEYLETEGVGVITFADGREGPVDFPGFWSRDSGVSSPMVVKDEAEAAAMIYAQHSLPLNSGLLFGNPVPAEHQIPLAELSSIIDEALDRAGRAGATGSANTPFVLQAIKELSGTQAIVANQALIEANVLRGAKVAIELSRLEHGSDAVSNREANVFRPANVHRGDEVLISPIAVKSSPVNGERVEAEVSSVTAAFSDPNTQAESYKADIIVAGSVAIDISCDYIPPTGAAEEISPTPYTSNPSAISQSLGGVGRNVTRAIHLMGGSVRLCGVVGNDLAGKIALETMTSEGLNTNSMKILPTSSNCNTARYVAANDGVKSLVIAMADTRILERQYPDFSLEWGSQVKRVKPKWLVLDANWNSNTIHQWISAAKLEGARTAFEPVSVVKSARLLARLIDKRSNISVFPNPTVDLATPNSLELSSMHASARDMGLFDREDWWHIIDAMGIPSTGARTELVQVTSESLVDAGVPQQCIQLLPFIPCLLTKLGRQGVLLTELLSSGDERLRSPDSAPYILARSKTESDGIGGIYMRLFPPPEIVPDDDVVSVNGVGDTFLGVLLSSLIKREGVRIEDVVDLAQSASILTLKSSEAVSPRIVELKDVI